MRDLGFAGGSPFPQPVSSQALGGISNIMQALIPIMQERKKRQFLQKTLGDVLNINQESAMPHHLKPYWNTPMETFSAMHDYTGQGLASLLRDPYANPNNQGVEGAWYDPGTSRFGMGGQQPTGAQAVNLPGAKFFPLLQNQRGQDLQGKALDMRGRLTKLQEAKGATSDDLNVIRGFNAVLQPILSVYSDQLDETSLGHINKALDEMEPAIMGLATKYKMKFGGEQAPTLQPKPKQVPFSAAPKTKVQSPFTPLAQQPQLISDPSKAKEGDFYRNKAGILLKAVSGGWTPVGE